METLLRLKRDKKEDFKKQIQVLRNLASEYRDKKTSFERKNKIAELLHSFGALNLNTGNGQFVIAI